MAWRELRGRPCCAESKRIEKGDERWFFCVCAWLEWCPTHGIAHVGTHD